MRTASDAQLLSEYAASGSEAAFAEIVNRHAAFVYSAALRQCGRPADAEEVAQRVFADLAHKAGRLSRHLSPEASLAGWLYRGTRYAVLNVLRAERRRRVREIASMEHYDEPPVTDHDWEQLAPILDEALAALRETDREAVLLRFFKNHDFQTIGQMLGVSDDAAQKRVTRALERLRSALAARGVALPAATVGGLLLANSVNAAPSAVTAELCNVALVTAAKKSGWANWLVWSVKTKMAAAITGVALVGTIAITSELEPKGGHFPAGTNNAAVTVGATHGLVLARDGSLWSWGTNYLGWNVLGTSGARPRPERVGSDNDWVQISSSATHCLGLRSDGSIWGWGQNVHGQLGKGPKHVPEPSLVAAEDWIQVAAGGAHSLGLRRDGTLWGWGANWGGHVGIGSTNSKVIEPTQVGSDTNWACIWAGGVASLAQKVDGTLWFWGSLTGEANGTNFFRAPTLVSTDTNWTEVGFGYFTIFGIKSDGTLWVWGRNAGIYTGGPIQLVNPTPMRIGTNTDWKAVSDSDRFYHVVQKVDGSIWAMNATAYSVLGRSNYPPVSFRRIELPPNIVSFAVAQVSGAALTREGELWVWGVELGNPVYTSGNRPLRRVADVLGWRTDAFKVRPIVREQPRRLSPVH